MGSGTCFVYGFLWTILVGRGNHLCMLISMNHLGGFRNLFCMWISMDHLGWSGKPFMYVDFYGPSWLVQEHDIYVNCT